MSRKRAIIKLTNQVKTLWKMLLCLSLQFGALWLDLRASNTFEWSKRWCNLLAFLLRVSWWHPHKAQFGTDLSISAIRCDGKGVTKRIRTHFSTDCLTLSTYENNFQVYSCAHGELLILLSFTHREWVLGCCAPTARDKEMKFIRGGCIFQTVPSQDIILLQQQAQ